ncbi:flagellar motor switch protein FliN/FliY [Modicisalibacter xianhensis]|uniref:Flagellar motor switch protein FliN n=1 Tax=Modicisalibacter xianhensis TaxID=442341 RepID=A0A4R8FVU7_9GAMM|nr:flagellar motor switch protein FliN [Halomonas xianhensis]TDX30978.1 flagellar motor switch protein FliN/FliY [Halomonas xianhensis]
MTDPKKPEQNSTDDAWADAMAEQGAGAPSADEDDPWAAAFAEQAEVEAELQVEVASSQATAAGDQVFKPLDSSASSGTMRDLEMIMDIPVKLTVELGRTRITIKQLLELAQGSVIELDGLAGEPMDILINGYLIAQGEVVVVDDKYGIRITEIITPSERVQKLNR